MFSCTGQCVPIAMGTSVGLKCSDCGEVSKGGLRGFWRNERLGMVRLVAVIFSIVTGISYKHLKKHLGVRLNKNTWTKYLKDLGLVVGEALERDRRTKKYFYAQADKVAFGNASTTGAVGARRMVYSVASPWSRWIQRPTRQPPLTFSFCLTTSAPFSSSPP